MTTEHEQLLARVAALIERAHWLHHDFGSSDTELSAASLASIVRSALIALEAGDVELAKNLLAGYLAQHARTDTGARQPLP
jgi:hypothetical protein